MKNHLLYFIKQSATVVALSMLLTGSFPPLLAQAQTSFTDYSNIYTPATTGGPNVAANSNTLPNTTPTGSFSTTAAGPTGTTNSTASPGTTAASTPAVQNSGVVSGNDIGCSVWNLVTGNTAGTFALCLTNVVYVFTVGIGSGFAYVAAYFFDWAIAISLNGTAYALSFVSQGWTTARDLANMAFLFILIYIAFKIMFEADTTSTVHMLVAVIVVALLVNFSFFFTRLAIDAGNILSIQFYNAIQAPSIASTAASQTAGVLSNSANASALNNALGAGTNKDLTASIMGMLQLQNLFNTDSFRAFFQPNGSAQPGAGFLVTTIALSFLYISAAIMFWLLTVAFVTNGVKFLLRVVVLWFLIIASPLAFVAYAIPKFEDYYWEWQKLLIKHAFYPVAFMFIFLILTNFANQMGGQNGLINGIFNGLQAANNSSGAVAAIGYAVANVGIRMGFVIAILYIGLRVSDQIGTMGADAAKHAGGWVGDRMTGAFKGSVKYGPGWATGAAYRNTFGGETPLVGAAWWDKKVAGSKWANRTGTLGGIVGYRLRRNVLAPMKETSLGTYASSYKERDTFLKERKTDMTNNLRDAETREVVVRVESQVAANKTANRPPEEGVAPKDLDRVQNLSKRELEAMKADQIKSMAGLFTESQIRTVKDLEKLSEKDKEDARLNWENNSKTAPLRIAREEVDTLREIRDELRVGRVNMPQVDTHIAGGATMNVVAIKEMKENIDEELAKARDQARDRAASAADRQLAEKNAIKLQQASNKLSDLGKNLKKVSADVGNRPLAEEFEVHP